MKRERNRLGLSPHWHVDCRIEEELPEDKVVGRRFLTNALFGAVTLAALLYTGYLGYKSMDISHQIRDWDQRISDSRAEVRDIKRLQGEYAAEAAKVDQAFALIRPRLFVSEFIGNLGRTRPEQTVIDIVEWNDAGIVIRGGLRETSERASRLLGAYVETLRRDVKMGPLFREIVLTDLHRGAGGEHLKFEISFRLKPPAS